jgi:hypothetical protein
MMHLRLCISTWEKKKKKLLFSFLFSWISGHRCHLHLQMHLCGARESFHVPEYFYTSVGPCFVHVPRASRALTGEIIGVTMRLKDCTLVYLDGPGFTAFRR